MRKIGSISAHIPGDYAYSDYIRVSYDIDTDDACVESFCTAPAGGMDARQYGNVETSTGKWLLRKPTGKELIRIIKGPAFKVADLVPKYGKPSKSFGWIVDDDPDPTEGLNVKLVDRALQYAKDIENQIKLMRST